MTSLARPKAIATTIAAALLLITWVARADVRQPHGAGFPLKYVDLID